MASAEVDQKALGNFAAITGVENPFLSAMLYKILGLSVMLSNKLLRARRLRRLDPTRETKSLQLYYQIIWLSREGLLILEEFVLPMVEGYVELKILAYKLRASFYHIFVLFHNQPAIHSPGITTSISSTGTVPNDPPQAEPDQTAPREQQTSRLSFRGKNEVLTVPTKPPNAPSESKLPRTKATAPQAPPGLALNQNLAPVQAPNPRPVSASFLLPALDYTPTATACFNHAALLAERFLPGSHPLRLSIKLEYAAYLYDCLQDATASRKLAKQAIADVYNAQEGMDDESFEDAAEIVGLLGKMVKRGAKKSTSKSTSGGSGNQGGGGGSSTTRSVSVTPRAESSRTRSEGNRTPTAGVRKNASASPRTAATTPMPVSPRTPKASAIQMSTSTTASGTTVRMGYSPAAVPDPTMINPI
ncbi:14-3-3 domain-containing protein [Aspergillus carlsbadensis]|nr:14-3-3 domain-containing protein [Aspergillus carlsbadensis]